MGQPLWAPWRMEYILGPKSSGPCVFCLADGTSAAELTERLVVCRTRRASVMLNRYPFAAAHLLIIPRQHVSDLSDLGADDYQALFWLVREAAARLRQAVKPGGLNVGMNLGEVAGAGIAEHLHVHVVPRWAGDSNFMPVLADTRVVPQSLDDTRAHLASYFDDLNEAAA